MFKHSLLAPPVVAMRHQRLIRAAVLGTLLLSPFAAQASTVIITVKGLIGGGYDNAGAFGPRGQLMAAKPFTATFSVDTTQGTNQATLGCDNDIEWNLIAGDPPINPIVGTVQIDSKPYYFGKAVANRPGNSLVEKNFCQSSSLVQTFDVQMNDAPDGPYVNNNQTLFKNLFIDLKTADVPFSSSSTPAQIASIPWYSALANPMVSYNGVVGYFDYDGIAFLTHANFMNLYVDVATPANPNATPLVTSLGFLPMSIDVSGLLPAAPPVTYNPAKLLPTGSSTKGGVSPQSAVADFNGDGNLDIVTTNINDSSISILFGNGDGSFRAPVNYTVPSGPYGIATGDFNGDNLPDIAITCGANASGTNSVSILLNTGSGTFAPRPEYTYKVGPVPYGIVVSDVNNDGIKDLVVSNAGGASVSVLIGKGDGSFAPQVPYAVGNLPYSVAVGDLNHDGFPDIVTADYEDQRISVLLNDGTGKFLPRATYLSLPSVVALAIADVNRDNFPDILVASLYQDLGLRVLPNDSNGGGTFKNEGNTPGYPIGRFPFSVVVTDMNGDGMPDLVVNNFGDNTISTLLGQADGTFVAQAVTPTATGPYSLAIGDFNNDGRPDLSISTYGPSTGVQLQTPPK